MQRSLKVRAILVIFILISSCIITILAVLPHVLKNGTSYTAYVYKDGNLIQTIPLSEIKDPYYRLIGDYDSDYNLIEAVSGFIRISEASCPDQVCVRQGYISHSLVPITCLPNHLVIELKADDAGQDTDAITH